MMYAKSSGLTSLTGLSKLAWAISRVLLNTILAVVFGNLDNQFSVVKSIAT